MALREWDARDVLPHGTQFCKTTWKTQVYHSWSLYFLKFFPWTCNLFSKESTPQMLNSWQKKNPLKKKIQKLISFKKLQVALRCVSATDHSHVYIQKKCKYKVLWKKHQKAEERQQVLPTRHLPVAWRLRFNSALPSSSEKPVCGPEAKHSIFNQTLARPQIISGTETSCTVSPTQMVESLQPAFLLLWGRFFLDLSHYLWPDTS